MKIAFINSSKFWGGGEKWHFENAKAAMELGHQVTVITYPNSELSKKCISENIPLQEIKVKKLSFLNPLMISKSADLFREGEFDAVILNLTTDLKLFGLAARMISFNNIYYRRGSALPVKATWLNRYLYNNVLKGVIVNSLATKDLLIGNGDLIKNNNKIHLIYNGLKFEDPIERNKRDSDELVIGNAGRLDEQKGQGYLLDLSQKLLARNIKHKILIAGSGKLESKLKEAASSNTNIEFLGFQDSLEKFYQEIDLFILSSKWEGFGFVIAEAMSHSVPVMAFNISSNPELIKDGETGYLIKAFDIEEMADRIVEIQKDPERMKELGQNASKFVRSSFQFKDKLNELLNLLSN